MCLEKNIKNPKALSPSRSVSNCDDSCQIILQKLDIVFNNGLCMAIYVLPTELSDYLEMKIYK